MTGTFTLKNSALLYPAAGFNPEGEHFGVMLDDQEIGTIYRIGDEWLWSINLGMMGSVAAALRAGEKPVGVPRSLGRVRRTAQASERFQSTGCWACP